MYLPVKQREDEWPEQSPEDLSDHVPAAPQPKARATVGPWHVGLRGPPACGRYPRARVLARRTLNGLGALTLITPRLSFLS